MIWRPNPGPQTTFLKSRANEVVYGGAAGGGKSAALFMLPLYWVNNPNYRGLYLRRQAKYLGDAIDKTNRIYPELGAKLALSPRIRWVFPSGAELWMNHCEHESDVANYDSFEFAEVLFDELTHFTETQYRGIRARLRGTDRSLPYWSRAGTNPGNIGHEWVFARFARWLDPSHEDHAEPGELRWFVGDEPSSKGAPLALSRTFIPARIEDNPHISDAYRAQLNDLSPLRRAQLLHGDWLRKPARKDYWDRDRVQIREGLPLASDVVARVRAWDFGATSDGDWTVGARLALLLSGLVVVEDVVRFRGDPSVVRARFASVSAGDAELDARCIQTIPQDPGQAGVDQVASYQREFPHLTIRPRRPSKDKVTRFGPVSSRALAGNLAIVRAGWNDTLHNELESFPEDNYDDQADALSDAYAELSGVGPPREPSRGADDVTESDRWGNAAGRGW